MNKLKFKDTYVKNLKLVRIECPEYYVWPIDQLDLVTSRMLRAIDNGSFNKDSLAFKKTCRELGIKHTYKAMKEFCNETEKERTNEKSNN